MTIDNKTTGLTPQACRLTLGMGLRVTGCSEQNWNMPLGLPTLIHLDLPQSLD
ncbi:MAG: hypothetical protein F6J90_00140 [Moorea sp. SIOASIH]|uniref:hypothetical protein n=1 Tax=Moorena sp. SIOASIH TaxID=2607817 RepID=UPI0013BE541C|nr:hypothetical protein [Moorena sp. SIOASIH]NEO34799.1 hypothetical protein [Moorena sp. SIOASIH]